MKMFLKELNFLKQNNKIIFTFCILRLGLRLKYFVHKKNKIVVSSWIMDSITYVNFGKGVSTHA